jgi:hypothetical protein
MLTFALLLKYLERKSFRRLRVLGGGSLYPPPPPDSITGAESYHVLHLLFSLFVAMIENIRKFQMNSPI